MRRSVVAVTVLSLALSGCLGAAAPGAVAGEWDGDPDNHWQQSVLTVSYETPADEDRDYEPLVHRALAYWTEHSEQYAGYDVGFRLAEAGETADVNVRFVDAVGDCGSDAAVEAAGCAPRLTDSRQVDRPVDVAVRTGLSDTSTVRVLKHELGHTLGLSHGDDPAVMDAHVEVTTVPQANASERASPWTTDDLVVHVDLESVPAGARDDAERQVGAALHYYMDGAEGTVPANTTFYRGDSPENADVTVEFVDRHPCRSSAGSCGRVAGDDPDGDGVVEYHDRLDVTLVDLDPDAVAWHVGRWLGRGFGHVHDGEYPEPLRGNASYGDRRSVWWK